MTVESSYCRDYHEGVRIRNRTDIGDVSYELIRFRCVTEYRINTYYEYIIFGDED